MTRYPHGPGDLLPAAVTAEALKLLRLACLKEAVRYERMIRREEQPQVRAVWEYNLKVYQGLATEIERTLNELPSLEKTGDHVRDEEPLIGRILFDIRLKALAEDRAELARRLEGHAEE